MTVERMTAPTMVETKKASERPMQQARSTSTKGRTADMSASSGAGSGMSASSSAAAVPRVSRESASSTSTSGDAKTVPGGEWSPKAGDAVDVSELGKSGEVSAAESFNHVSKL